MGLLGRLALLFVLVPLVELWLLVRMGGWIGVLPTIALVVLTGVAGAALARREGLRTLREARASLARGELPGRPLMDGMAILTGGALLLTPGLLTDVVGFALLLPPSRAQVRRLVRRSLERRIREGTLRVTVWGSEGPGRGPASGRTDDPSRHGLDPDKEIEIR